MEVVSLCPLPYRDVNFNNRRGHNRHGTHPQVHWATTTNIIAHYPHHIRCVSYSVFPALVNQLQPDAHQNYTRRLNNMKIYSFQDSCAIVAQILHNSTNTRQQTTRFPPPAQSLCRSAPSYTQIVDSPSITSTCTAKTSRRGSIINRKKGTKRLNLNFLATTPAMHRSATHSTSIISRKDGNFSTKTTE